MPENIDIKIVIDTNPLIDQEQLQESLAISKELRDTGVVAPREYSLVTPFTRRVATHADDESRLVRLTRRK